MATAHDTIDDSQRSAHPDEENDEDDDRPAPFPPYREPDETEEGEEVQSHGHDPIGISVQADPAPQSESIPEASEPLSEPIAETTSESNPQATSDSSSSSTPTHEPTQTSEPASESAPEMEPFVQPRPPSPVLSPPAPPPPYWTHSRDGSQGVNSLNNVGGDAARPATAVATTGRTNATTSFFSAPFLRRLDSSSRSQGTASTSSSTTQRPSTGTTHTSSTYIGNRGHGNGQPYYQGHHRRDTSSSTLDLNVNLITLQDNEAADDEGYDNSSGWQYNGASADPLSPSALSSPTTSALLSPGPPPGSAGSSNTSHGRPGNTSPLTATRTSSNTPKNTNYSRCWARRVDITDHVVIGAGNSSSGGGLFSGFSNNSNNAVQPRLGAFVVWTIRVQTLDGSSGNPNSPQSPNASSSSAGHSFCIYKRYSEFDTLRRRLVASFPQARGGGALPPLPPKSVLGKFRPAFLEQRRLGLQYFLNCILLNPEFAGSPVLQDFLFS
ncbi:hypothetical protein Sste5346_006943 [Sporothrix stenoceras]|uniref:Endosomal/vacuolar adapter protein YPT35 n=1 Tax=Sporothrix stenoceras TaxID=5173 RepID=A0ABR3YXL1_9PEZI